MPRPAAIARAGRTVRFLIVSTVPKCFLSGGSRPRSGKGMSLPPFVSPRTPVFVPGADLVPATFGDFTFHQPDLWMLSYNPTGRV